MEGLNREVAEGRERLSTWEERRMEWMPGGAWRGSAQGPSRADIAYRNDRWLVSGNSREEGEGEGGGGG